MRQSLEKHSESTELSKKEKLEHLSNSLQSAEKAGIIERWKKVMSVEESKEALRSLARLGVNLTFTIADMFPGAGEVLEPALDAYKTASRVVPALRKFDPTKDVGIAETFAIQAISAPTEAVTFGTSPTYLINTLRQTWADYKSGNFGRAKEAVGYLITGDESYYTKLKERSASLDQAAGVFKK
jgi:hypothetical protein